MSKFKSRERVTYEELSHFIQPLKMEIPINLQTPFVRNSSFNLYLREINKEIVETLFTGMDDKKKEYLKRAIPISYVPHIEGYSVSLSPIQFVNNALRVIGRTNNVNLNDYLLPFYNLDDERELKVFKTAVKNRIFHIKKSIINENLSKDLNILNSNLEEIIKIKDFDLSEMVNNCIEIKTLLFYIVYYSLRKLQETNNPIYSVLPSTYVEEVYKPDALQFPKHVYLDSYNYRYGIASFIEEYNRLYTTNRGLFNHFVTDNLGVNTYVGNFELLPSGEVEKTLKEEAVKQKYRRDIDYSKYYKLFKTKIDYYFHTDIKHILVGNMGLEGYYAFVYGNEYIVSDKFYNSLLVPDYKRSILTHEEGLYALPSDRLDILAMDKQKIKEEKKTDTRIKKHNHDQNNNWINKVNAIIEGANVSTTIFTNELVELENKGILTLSKKI